MAMTDQQSCPSCKARITIFLVRPLKRFLRPRNGNKAIGAKNGTQTLTPNHTRSFKNSMATWKNDKPSMLQESTVRSKYFVR